MTTPVQRFYSRGKKHLAKESDLPNFFAYHLTIELGHSAATVAAVKKCYEECDLHAPSWLASHFSNGLKSKPRRFLKRNGGYRLEESLRDEIGVQLANDNSGKGPNLDTKAEPAGIEYAGVAGASGDCREAVEMILQYGTNLERARILTYDNDHCILLTDDTGDSIAIKSGFASGYGGEGSRTFSYVLRLLEMHGAHIDECDVDAATIERLDNSALTLSDLRRLVESKPFRPARWRSYIDEADYERGRNGTLWMDFPPVLPFAVIDSRIMDLAISFWKDPDDRLLKAYRRLEDVVRERTQLQEHGTKLFSQAFVGSTPKLTWPNIDEAEKIGRANLFTAAYMAHRNPRAHRELQSYRDAQLSEFLLLNHLFRLEKESQ